MRIPGWARNEAIPGSLYRFGNVSEDSVTIALNGAPVKLQVVNGYASIERKWKKGDKVELDLPMPVRTVEADGHVRDDAGKIAVQRGPLVFCAEWPDNPDGKVLNLLINPKSGFSAGFNPQLMGGVETIKTKGNQTVRRLDGKTDTLAGEQITLIPYAYWNNRGPGQMKVWIPTVMEASHPSPAPTIAFTSRVKASRMTRELAAVNDQDVPAGSYDPSVSNYNWWPDTSQWEFVEYDFARPATISKTSVYWFDDGPDGGCRIPDEWEVLYLTGNTWEPVKNRNSYKVTKDARNTVSFNPVKATALKIKVKLNKRFSAGIYEWVVE